VPFAKCIKSGIDNPGHPLLKIVGAVAGDEECYTVFKELFDPLIRVRHGGYGPDSLHTTDLSAERVTNTRIDPCGRYVISSRVRSSRSLRGLRFPPACDRAERRKVEQILSTALTGLTDDELRGAYFPLRGSTSYEPKPEGMTFEEEADLRRQNLLFQEPDSSVLLCSGMGRHWPEARGVFLADSRKLVAWLNEEDHMRIISMQLGDSLREAFLCFSKGLEGIESSLKSQGCAFAHNDHLGYISSCPSNLGTGLRASVMLRLPLLGATRHIQSICRSLGLQARGGLVPTSNGEELGVWDVSNRERLGVSEVDLVNTVIAGCTELVALEQALERGEELPGAPLKPEEAWNLQAQRSPTEAELQEAAEAERLAREEEERRLRAAAEAEEQKRQAEEERIAREEEERRAREEEARRAREAEEEERKKRMEEAKALQEARAELEAMRKRAEAAERRAEAAERTPKAGQEAKAGQEPKALQEAKAELEAVRKRAEAAEKECESLNQYIEYMEDVSRSEKQTKGQTGDARSVGQGQASSSTAPAAREYAAPPPAVNEYAAPPPTVNASSSSRAAPPPRRR